jgi:hypothetical protein
MLKIFFRFIFGDFIVCKLGFHRFTFVLRKNGTMNPNKSQCIYCHKIETKNFDGSWD